MIGPETLKTQHFNREIVSIKLVLKNLIGKNNEKAGYHRSDIRTNENTSAHRGGTINNCNVVCTHEETLSGLSGTCTASKLSVPYLQVPSRNKYLVNMGQR